MTLLDIFELGDGFALDAGLDGAALVTTRDGKEVGAPVRGATGDNISQVAKVKNLSAYRHEYRKANLDRDSGEFDTEPDERPASSLAEANVIASTILGANGEPTGYHTVMLDIDHPVRVVPSSTPGHYHLYIDVPLTWEDYSKAVNALGETGIIQGGYAQASIERGHTDLRLPWVKKETPEVAA